VLINSVNPVLKDINARRIKPYKINFTQALDSMKNSIILLMHNEYNTVCDLVTELQISILAAIELIRPGRQYKRNFRKRNKRFHYEYRQPA